MSHNGTSFQQAVRGGQVRIPRTTMQAVDMERQAAMSTSPRSSSPHFGQQPVFPQTQQEQVMQRSMSALPNQKLVGARRMSSALQAGILSNMDDNRHPSPKRASFDPQLEHEASNQGILSNMDDNRHLSPKRASFDPQLEHEASIQGRYPSPTKRKTTFVNPSSFDITAPPPQQDVAFSRKSIMQQQGQPMSLRESMMNIPPSQPVSPRKSMVQQQLLQQPAMSSRNSQFQQPLSPTRKSTPGAGLQGNAARGSVSMYPQEHSTPSSQPENLPSKSTRLQPGTGLQGNAVRSITMYQQEHSPRKPALFQPGAGLQGNAARSVRMYQQEHSAPSSQRENFPASTSYVNQRSMSIAPAAQMQRDEEDDNDDDNHGIDDGGGGGYNLETMKMSRSMSIAPTAQMQHDEEDDNDDDNHGIDDGGGGGHNMETMKMSRSMSIAPAAQMQRDEEDDNHGIDEGGGGYNLETMTVSRSTSMTPLATPTVQFQDNQSVCMPTTNHNQMVTRAATLARPEQVTRANTHPHPLSVSPRLMQTQQQLQQSAAPARLQQSSICRSKSSSPSQMSLEQPRQSVISRSRSMSPTQMNAEQQRQARLSSANLASAQGVRPGSPPQLNRHLSTAGPRVSVVTPSRASNIFQPLQLLSVPSAKRMQLGRKSLEHGASSSSSFGSVNREWPLSITDVVLRSMAAIASAVAFCVMITNTVWINNQTISYSNFAGFRAISESTQTTSVANEAAPTQAPKVFACPQATNPTSVDQETDIPPTLFLDKCDELTQESFSLDTAQSVELKEPIKAQKHGSNMDRTLKLQQKTEDTAHKKMVVGNLGNIDHVPTCRLVHATFQKKLQKLNHPSLQDNFKGVMNLMTYAQSPLKRVKEQLSRSSHQHSTVFDFQPPVTDIVSLEKPVSVDILDSPMRSPSFNVTDFQTEEVESTRLMIKRDKLQQLQKDSVKGKFVIDNQINPTLTYNTPTSKFIQENETVQSLNDSGVLAIQIGWNTIVNGISQMMAAAYQALEEYRQELDREKQFNAQLLKEKMT
ncbi:hypothetical protein L7F22_025011 [Adiantum nelumboides]|nr:hypothetical protein [Adiantum nelumboides]